MGGFCVKKLLVFQIFYRGNCGYQSDMREAIQIGIIGHIEPRHMQSQLQQILYGVGEKSVFVQGAIEVDIEQMVCETIMFPTLEVMRFHL